MTDPQSGEALSSNDVARYIDSVRWQYAKTMPDWPHEYTVKDWRPDLYDAFKAFCTLVEEHGTVQPWLLAPAAPIYRNRYLIIGSHKYWTMGPRGDQDPIEEKTVINRALL